jgi:hypothetical protein
MHNFSTFARTVFQVGVANGGDRCVTRPNIAGQLAADRPALGQEGGGEGALLGGHGSSLMT